MDEFDRQRLTDPALLVRSLESIELATRLTALRQNQGLTIYHLAMRMGYLDQKAEEALQPFLDRLTDTNLREFLSGRIRQHIEALVQPLRDLERGHKEWTLTDVMSYAHAVGRTVLLQLVPEEGEYSIEARFAAIKTRHRSIT